MPARQFLPLIVKWNVGDNSCLYTPESSQRSDLKADSLISFLIVDLGKF